MFLKNFLRYCTTSSRSWPSTIVPFFLLRTSNPSWCIHFRAVSTNICLGNPGSRVSFGRRLSLTHSQKPATVRLGTPFKLAFSLINLVAFLLKHSLDQRTPDLWYFPWFESTISPSCSKNLDLHSCIVCYSCLSSTLHIQQPSFLQYPMSCWAEKTEE